MHKAVLYKVRDRFTKKGSLFIKRSLTTLLASLGLIGVFQIATAFGAPPPPSSVNIEQCANGPAAGPFNICKLLSGNDGYVTGSVNATKAHWKEGDFLPYRGIVEAPNSGTQQVSFSFDTAKSSELRHAIDYLSSYDLTETTGSATSTHANQADPCSDVIATCNRLVPNATFAIPVPTSLTSAYPLSCANGTFSGSPTTGSLKAWVSTGTLTINNVTVGAPDTGSTDCPSKITIDFTLTNASSKVVFAFGGHIAASVNPGSGGYWGTGNALPTGSPYHLHAGFDQISGGATFQVGNQDLALASAAVAQTPTAITELHNNSGGAVIPLNSSVNSGTSVYDIVTVGGTTNGTPTGTADFRFYSSVAACTTDTGFTGGITQGTGVALVSGVAQSTATGSLGAGTYAFKAKFNSGDISKWVGGSLSGCEPFTVNQGSSAVTTTLKNASNVTVTEGSSVPLGTVLHDLATVTLTPSAVPTGSVTFRFYSTVAACTNDANFSGGTTKGTVALDGNNPGVANPSDNTGALTAGSYAFKANWPGNANYQGSTSSCETFTVNKVQLGVGTTVHSDSPDQALTGNLSLGSGAHDSASVTGKVGTFTLPDVTFYFFDKGVSCTNGSTVGGTQLNTVSPDGSGVAHPSTSQTNLAAGTYNFMAVVAGNTNYDGATGNCEPFTVDKAQLTADTKVHDANHADKTNSSTPLGSVMHDTAKLTGSVGGFSTPAVTFTFYINGTCDGDGTSVANTGADEGDASAVRSAASAALSFGSYSYKATVAGDDNYLGDSSDCEPFTVSKANLGIGTTIHDSAHNPVTSVALGSVVHDTASVSGQVGTITPTGAVTFEFFTSANCTTGASAVTNTGADGSDVRSADSAALAAGSYSYHATVAGDDNYNGKTSDCEPLTVNKAQLGVSTIVHDAAHTDKTNASVPLGSLMHDTATVTGGVNGFALPAVSFTLTNNYSDSCASGSSVANNGTEGGATKSADSGALAAGNYAYRGSVAGNDNYIGANSACEPFTVNKAQLTVTTAVHNAGHVDKTNASVPLGSVMHDTATVTGGVSGFTLPAVSFTLTTGYTDACDNGAAVANNGTESGATKSADSSALGANSYAYRATVAGNDNYLSDDSDCEPFTVSKADLTLTTDIHDADHNVVTAVNVGGTVHDQANVSGIVSGIAPANNITFTFYRNGNCTTGTPESAGSHAISAGVAHPSDSKGPLNAGSYAFKASYDGSNDLNYNSSNSDCEPLTINKVTPGITTTPSAGGNVGTTLNDSASLTNGFSPTGSITFKLYSPSDPTCTNTPAFTNVVTVNGNGNYNTSAGFASNASGTWRWVAVYSGDGNNNSVTSGCNDEQVTISSPTTRTLGFWQTHYTYTSNVFGLNINPAIWTICSGGRTINNTATLFGGFYASIPKKSDGKTKRSDLDQARMQLMQQLLAAILNNLAFGGGGALIGPAKAAYCGTDKAAILSQVSILDAFNNSGDSQPTAQNTGKADPKASKDAANLAVWDILP